MIPKNLNSKSEEQKGVFPAQEFAPKVSPDYFQEDKKNTEESKLSKKLEGVPEDAREAVLLYETAKHKRERLPSCFMQPRRAVYTISELRRFLFDTRETLPFVHAREGDYYSFFLALHKKLSNDSYLAGNEKDLSGLLGRANPFIKISMKEIIRDGYGVEKPNSSMLKATDELISYLENHDVIIRSPETGKKRAEVRVLAKVCTYFGEDEQNLYLREYYFLINPLLKDLSHGYGSLSQNFARELTKVAGNGKTGKDLSLSMLLAEQKEGTCFQRYFDKLAEELGMKKTYIKDRGRCEKQIKKMFQRQLDKENPLIDKVDYKEKEDFRETKEGVFRGKRILFVTAHRTERKGETLTPKDAPDPGEIK